MSLACKRPMRLASLYRLTVMILSTMTADRVSRPLLSFESITTRNVADNPTLLVKRHTVIESVAENRSACRINTGRGLLR